MAHLGLRGLRARYQPVRGRWHDAVSGLRDRRLSVVDRAQRATSMNGDLAVLDRLRRNWPEYLIEAWALGSFMVSAGVFATLFDYPGSPVHRAIESADLRRALVGVAMGLTAI